MITEAARARLARHAERMRREAKLLYACELEPQLAAAGHFFPPHLFELRSLDQLKTEEFGPILHVARYRSGELPQVLAAIRATGYGLTLGVHSRLESVAQHVFSSLPVGNTYVNRNMIGAVVGVQPFGGQGLSGTGPKAGGPHYLLRFANASASLHHQHRRHRRQCRAARRSSVRSGGTHAGGRCRISHGRELIGELWRYRARVAASRSVSAARAASPF